MRPDGGSPHSDATSPAGRSSGVGEPAGLVDLEPEELEDDDSGMPRSGITRREAIIFGGFAVAVVAFLYFGLPQLAGFEDTWSRIKQGDPAWLLACLAFEVLSLAGYIWLFRVVFVKGSGRITWGVSYLVTMAGVAATRLFAAAGAGGAVLTVWALRRSGMRSRVVAVRVVAQYVLLYGVYMVSLVVVGVGLYEGILPGGGDFAITIVPAILGGCAIVAALAFTLVPTQIDRTLDRWAGGEGRWSGLLVQISKAPAAVSAGVREAIRMVREREGVVLGSIAWWYLNIGVLWAAFHAFGEAPPFAVIVMGYFVGMLGNLLPLPGGLGGVDGGMIGAFVAFGVPFSLATVAVLTYRAFAFWLPTIPGVIAYFQLRGVVQRWRDEGPAKREGAPAPAGSEAGPVRAV
jgi:uncharacterized protein (TIRG00374 family)